jgi:hypothetical protein
LLTHLCSHFLLTPLPLQRRRAFPISSNDII